MRLFIVWLVGLVLLTTGCAAESSQPPAESTPSGAADVLHSQNDVLDLVTGQLVFVPAYSDIYTSGDGRTIDLAITLSVNNTDLTYPIIVTAIRYYDTDGNLVRNYVEEPLRLPPMASTHVIIDSTDETGGVGANFLVEWGAEHVVHEPVIEAVMVNTASQQGLSLITPGRVISQTERLAPDE